MNYVYPRQLLVYFGISSCSLSYNYLIYFFFPGWQNVYKIYTKCGQNFRLTMLLLFMGIVGSQDHWSVCNEEDVLKVKGYVILNSTAIVHAATWLPLAVSSSPSKTCSVFQTTVLELVKLSNHQSIAIDWDKCLVYQSIAILALVVAYHNTFNVPLIFVFVFW